MATLSLKSLKPETFPAKEDAPSPDCGASACATRACGMGLAAGAAGLCLVTVTSGPAHAPGDILGGPVIPEAKAALEKGGFELAEASSRVIRV